MRIETINIRNFRSYYGDNEFILSPGLTIITAGNGDGKTTFLKALEWLFKTLPEENPRLRDFISAKRKSELSIGESDTVSVGMTFEHNGRKEIVKTYTFRKVDENNIAIENFEFAGYYIDGAERRSVKGADLLDQCFEPVIRRYSMFEGEHALHIFDHDRTALRTLVDNFSDVRNLDPLLRISEALRNKSDRASAAALRNDKKVAREFKELEATLGTVTSKIDELKRELVERERAVAEFTSELENLGNNKEVSRRYNTIRERLENLTSRRATYAVNSRCRYTTNLLDEQWILRSFSPILDTFSEKVSKMQIEKRRLEHEEIRRKAREQAEHEMILDFLPLPLNLPDEDTMREMLRDERCKVCGTPAPIGSPAYNFMQERLNQYLNHVNANTDDNENPLFPNSFIDELNQIKIRLRGETEREISNIATVISEKLEFIAEQRELLGEVEIEMDELRQEQDEIRIQSNLTDEQLTNTIYDFVGNFEANNRAQERIGKLKTQLEDEEKKKNEIQEKISKLSPNDQKTKLYQRISTMFGMINDAFSAARAINIDSFLRRLEEESNRYLSEFNKDNYYGIIRIKKDTDDSVRIGLYSSDNEKIVAPNGALVTTMYMSVLFAINQITTLTREQNYPLIFDAPTSTFAANTTSNFYNVINTIEKQCIICTKDFVDEGGGGEEEVILKTDEVNRINCEAFYWTKKQRPFNEIDLSTIQTIVEKII